MTADPERQHTGRLAPCRRCCASCYIRCKPCMTKYNSLDSNATRKEKVKHAFFCPPHGNVAKLLVKALALFFIWAVLWAITKKEALPGGNFFSLMVLFILANLGGWVTQKIRLPPLLGMLIVGGMLRNIPKIKDTIGVKIDPAWSSTLRTTALVVILTRAGLGLDPVALRKNGWGVVRLAFIPCLVEACCAAGTSYGFMQAPPDWGFLVGFVIAAVSPAVVVPVMLALGESGYGIRKGIPTLVIASASIDDVLAISGFSICLSIVFSKGSVALAVIKGPLELVIGIAYGVVVGVVCWYLPHSKFSTKTLFRFILLASGGMLVTFGSSALDLKGAGALGCLTFAFVVGLRWKAEMEKGVTLPLIPIFGRLWQVFQPLLFGLIGAQLDISTIKGDTVGLGLAVLAIGLVVRMIASCLAVFGLGFNIKEKLFIPIAWLPKATVQAAIGGVALDEARNLPDGDERKVRYIEYATKVLTIAVLVILVTAPIGSVAMTIGGPRMLAWDDPKKLAEEREKEKEAEKGKEEQSASNGHVNAAYSNDLESSSSKDDDKMDPSAATRF